MASYTYRNSNTGDEVTYPKRSPRLDALPNWEQTKGPAKKAAKENDPPPPPNPDGSQNPPPPNPSGGE